MAKKRSQPNATGQADPLAEHLANALSAHEKGQLDKAERLYAHILKQRPRHAEALHFSGVLQLQRGQLEPGVAQIQAAILIAPDARMRSNLATGLIRLRRYAQALVQLDLAVAENDRDPSIHTNRGIALAGLGRHQEAIASHRQALLLNPRFVEAWNNLGNSQRALAAYQDALSSYAQALNLQPAYLEALNNKALALMGLMRLDEALACLETVLARRPTYTDAWINQGNAFKLKGTFAQAHASYAHALSLRPQDVDAKYNQGICYLSENKLDDARQSFEAVLALAPEHVEVHWNLALVHLLNGAYAQGWPLFAWRWKLPQAESARFADRPQWQGAEALSGRSILVWAEQGLGDTLQFSRYALNLLAQGARVVMEVQAPLVSLLQRLSPTLEVIARGESAPATDYQCALMDLPGVLGLAEAAFCPSHPYLSSLPARRADWQARLHTGQKPRVGIVCSGNPRLAHDRQRSIPLQSFAPLFEQADCYLVQKDCRDEDLQYLTTQIRMTDLHTELKDFEDTAAVLESLDLLISVDTSVAHLAGALGRPVWLLLSFSPDWRWQLGREDSPWYPGVRLYRQPAYGDWERVMQRLSADLASWAASQT